MVRFLAASAAVLSLMATSAIAQDTSVLFGHFKTLCAEGEGAGERALTMGRAAGWAPIPSTMFGDTDNPFDDVTILMNAEEDDVVSMLMVGTMTQEFEGTAFTMTVCATMGGNFQTQQALKPEPAPIIQQWLGMESHPDLSSDEMVGYAFTRDGEALAAVRPSEAALMQNMLNGQLHVVMTNAVGSQEDITMVMYLRPGM